MRINKAIVGSGIVIITYYFFMLNLSAIGEWTSRLIDILKPFFFGGLIAILLNNLTNKIERKFKFKQKRVVASLLSILITMLFVVLFAMVIVPQLIDSLMILVENSSSYLLNFTRWLGEIDINFKGSEELSNSLIEYLKSTLTFISTNIPVLIEKASATISGITSFVVSICVAAYMLIDKERLLSDYDKYGRLLNKKIKKFLDELINVSYLKLNNYFSGRVIDSTIIGVLCLISMAVLRIDFAMLISVIVGLTNIIPVVGPFIGGLVGLFILLLTNPEQAIWFAILILILQQLDGNVIGPKIMGDTMGLSSLSVLFIIIIGGGLFGFYGVLFGVPVLSIAKELFIKRLIKEEKTVNFL